MVRNLLEQRLEVLRGELEAGGRLLAELEARHADTRQTLLRIDGAVQVIEELLREEAVRREPVREVPVHDEPVHRQPTREEPTGRAPVVPTATERAAAD